MTMETPSTPVALDGITVLDFSQVMAGPFCTMLLGDVGADVIKVEPRRGDLTRAMAGASEGFSPAFGAVNRNKRSIVVDLKHTRGQEIARQLIAHADVLVENFRPGVMAKFGLDYPDVRDHNPGLIYASISGFGQTGPSSGRGGFDLIAQGMSGIMSVTGEEGRPPVKCGIPVTDLGAGLMALYGILAALLHRERTGQGQYIDTSLLEAGVGLSVWEATQYFSGRGVPKPMGSAHRMSAPYQAIRCSDGYITVGAANERTWRRFADLCGHPEWCDDPRFRTPSDRVEHRQELTAAIEAVTTQKPCAYWLEQLKGAGIPAGPILDYSDVFADPHVRARDMIWEYEAPNADPQRTLGNPVKLSETPAALRRRPPALGEHTRQILAALGYSVEEVDRLLSDGVVHTPERG